MKHLLIIFLSLHMVTSVQAQSRLNQQPSETEQYFLDLFEDTLIQVNKWEVAIDSGEIDRDMFDFLSGSRASNLFNALLLCEFKSLRREFRSTFKKCSNNFNNAALRFRALADQNLLTEQLGISTKAVNSTRRVISMAINKINEARYPEEAGHGVEWVVPASN